ncbi:MAG: hypothetical protein AAF957_02825 [Planctomycetota bacterium]
MRTMALALVAIAGIAALLATLLVSDDDAPQPGDGGTPQIIDRRDAPSVEATDDGDENDEPEPVPALPETDPGTDATPTDAREPSSPTAPVARAEDLRMSPFRGSVMLQREGDRPVGVALGSMSYDVLLRGRRESFEVDISGGRFETQVPSVARIVLTGGVLDGETVRFPGLEAPFDPTEDDQVIVGAPFARIVLRVVDGGQRSPLTDVTVRVAGSSTAALLADEPDDGRVHVSGKASPVVLPWLPNEGATWLRVSAPGYAAATVMVQRERASEKEIELWPPSDLEVRVTGPGRTRLRAVVLLMESTEERQGQSAVFSKTRPGVLEDADAIVFPIRGLSAGPYEVVAKGYDGAGRAMDLTGKRIELGANEARTLELYVDD